MRLRSFALVLGLAALVQTGCKSCHSCGTVSPPYPVNTNPPAVAPVPANAPAPATAPIVGAMLPDTDPDRPPVNPPLPTVRPTQPASFNRLTSWSR